MKYEFQNKIVLVTGAATGIGRAAALAFARAGATVVISDVNDQEAQITLTQIVKEDGKAQFIHCDVTSSEQVQSMVQKIVQQFGRLDHAYNNAGIEGESASTAECTEANWDKVIATNLKSIWLCMKYQIPQMLKQGGGSIVNCASVAGLVGFPSMPAYVASKHGIVGLTKTAALECVKQNIRINAVCPGAILTPMLERIAHGGEQEAIKQFSAIEPMARLGKPEEIADAVLWLSSDMASFVTGQALAVDGGLVSQ